MKFGVPIFSYSNMSNFRDIFLSDRLISINIGDYMQTIAVARILAEIGVDSDDVVEIDRDTITAYDGDRVALIMNGCFYDWCFPLPDKIRPVFIGFQAARDVLRANKDYLKGFEPIGCRDVSTCNALMGLGVAATVTGCLTLTLPQRSRRPETERTFIVYGEHAGQLPPTLLKHIPPEVLDTAEFISQRKVVHEHPLSLKSMVEAKAHAHFLLRRYECEATRIITPLHHAATPAMALGVPVTITRQNPNSRFSFLRTFTKVYLPEEFPCICWADASVEIGAIRSGLIEAVRSALERV